MKTFCLTVIMVVLNYAATAQVNGCWRDTGLQRGSVTYAQKQFDDQVLLYLNKNEQHLALDTADYVLIVKLSNSISFNRWRSKNCLDQELYEQFDSVFSDMSRYNKVISYLGTCIPNKGLGCYFEKFKLDWGGNHPNELSMFKVIN
jgi:hypothetical protein